MENVVSYYDAYVEGETMWFSNLNYNGLMKVNRQTGAVTLVDRFPHYEAWRQNIHRRVIAFDGVLYFVPFSGKIISMYVMATKKWDSIELEQEIDLQIVEAIQEGESLWLFPQYLKQPIRVVDLKTRKVRVLESLSKELGMYSLRALDFTSVCKKDGCFYIAVYNDYRIVKLAIATEKAEILSLETKYKFQGISVCGEAGFWLSCTNTNVISLWNEQQGVFGTFQPEGPQEVAARAPYMAIVDTDRTAFVLPCYTNEMYAIDKNSQRMSKLTLPSGFKRCRGLTMCTGYGVSEDAVWVYPRSGNQLLKICLSDVSVEGISLQFASETEAEYQYAMLRQNMEANLYTGGLREDIGWTEVLPEFFSILEKQESVEVLAQEESAGKRIWANVIGDLRGGEGK